MTERKRQVRAAEQQEDSRELEEITLLVDRDVMQRFKLSGSDWRERMEEAIRSFARSKGAH
ncbi:MAG TPA: BrnA antitoxin family protein [Tianweitania sediminis]|nr:BrnA antitoxin family protein [Tianweitania sediminis]